MNRDELQNTLEALETIEQMSEDRYEQYSHVGLNMLSEEDIIELCDRPSVDGMANFTPEILQRYLTHIDRFVKCLKAVGGLAGFYARQAEHRKKLVLQCFSEEELHTFCQQVEIEYNLPETPLAELKEINLKVIRFAQNDPDVRGRMIPYQ